MNILLINHYAGSPELGMEFRPYYMAKEWRKQGHKVLIVAATYSHLRKKQPLKSGREVIDGINYYWVETNVYNGNGVGRIIAMFLFVFKLFFRCGKLWQKFQPDVVIASSTYPLDIYPAHKIAKRYRAKLIYEVHDLWPLSPMVIGGYSKWNPLIMVVQNAENYAYKHADKVISLLWNAEQHMREHGLAEGKFKCIPNGYSKADWECVDLEEKLPEAHEALFEKIKNDVIVGFAGGFAASGSLDTLVKAAVLLKEKDNLSFVLVGKGVEQENLEKLVEEYSLSNVFFLPAVKKIQVPLIIKYFDIAYMGGVHSKLHFYGTSYNKLTDYMLASKPIVLSIDEPNALAERVECGIRVEAENANAVAEAILMLTVMSEDERNNIGAKGVIYVRENLEYGTLAKKFIEEVCQC